MAGQYDVSTTAMQQSQTRVVSNAGDIRSELAALTGKLAALQGQWIGDGNTAFVGAQTRYEEANRKLNAALDEIGSALSQAHTRYGTDDADAQSSLSGSMPGF